MPKPLLIEDLVIETIELFKELEKNLNYWFLFQVKMTYIRYSYWNYYHVFKKLINPWLNLKEIANLTF